MIDPNLPALRPSSIEELVELGSYCESLMSHPTFNRLTTMFAHDAFTHFVSTKPEDKAKREAIYAPIDGLQQFLSSMLVLVAAKNKYLNPEDAPSNEDEEFSVDAE